MDDIINKSTAKLRYNARFKQLDTQEFTDQYEFLTPGVKKVYVEELSRKGTRLTKEEVKIRKAIDNALKSERLYAAERKKPLPNSAGKQSKSSFSCAFGFRYIYKYEKAF